MQGGLRGAGNAQADQSGVGIPVSSHLFSHRSASIFSEASSTPDFNPSDGDLGRRLTSISKNSTALAVDRLAHTLRNFKISKRRSLVFSGGNVPDAESRAAELEGMVEAKKIENQRLQDRLDATKQYFSNLHSFQVKASKANNAARDVAAGQRQRTLSAPPALRMAREEAHVGGAVTVRKENAEQKGDVGDVLDRCVSEAGMTRGGTGILKKKESESIAHPIPAYDAASLKRKTRLSEESVAEATKRMRSDRDQTPPTVQEASAPSQRVAEDEIQETANGNAIGHDSPSDGYTPSIFACIAGFLAGNDAYASLAAFSLASRAVRAAVCPVLFESVILDGKVGGYDAALLKECLEVNKKNFEYTKFLFISHDHLDAISHETMSTDVRRTCPNLRVSVRWEDKENAPEASSPAVALGLHAPVTSVELNELLAHTDLRSLPGGVPSGKTQKWNIGCITSVRCEREGKILGKAVEPDQYFNRIGGSLTVRFHPEVQAADGRNSFHWILNIMHDRNAPLKGPDTLARRGDGSMTLGLEADIEQLVPLCDRIRLIAVQTQFRTIVIHVHLPNAKHAYEQVHEVFETISDTLSSLWANLGKKRQQACRSKDGEEQPPFFRLSAHLTDDSEFLGTLTPSWGRNKKGKMVSELIKFAGRQQ